MVTISKNRFKQTVSDEKVICSNILGRVGLGMMTLLTLTAMFGSTRQNVPRVSYVSYLDVWMVTCILFVFASMIEFVVVQFLFKSKRNTWGKSVEHIMRIAIPVVFVVFNIMYWTRLGLF